jgi:hypothetical protein
VRKEQGVAESTHGKSTPPPEDREWLLAQYTALREEAVKRGEQNNQFLAVGISAVGIIAAVAVKLNSWTILIVALPFICVAILIPWWHNLLLSRKLGKFIRTAIEERLSSNPNERAWEHVRGRSRRRLIPDWLR